MNNISEKIQNIANNSQRVYEDLDSHKVLQVAASYDEEKDAYIASHTPAEIFEHVNNNGMAILRDEIFYYHLISFNEESTLFGSLSDENFQYKAIINSDKTMQLWEECYPHYEQMQAEFDVRPTTLVVTITQNNDTDELQASHTSTEIRNHVKNGGHALLWCDGHYYNLSTVEDYDGGYVIFQAILEDGSLELFEISPRGHVHHTIEALLTSASSVSISQLYADDGLNMAGQGISDVSSLSMSNETEIYMNNSSIEDISGLYFTAGVAVDSASESSDDGKILNFYGYRLIDGQRVPVRLHGLADGMENNDAVNVGQLKSLTVKIETLENRLNSLTSAEEASF